MDINQTDKSMIGVVKYERREKDAYWTPEWCTKELLKHFRFPVEVIEPACGVGNISFILENYDYIVSSFDIKDYGVNAPVMDFLSWSGDNYTECIITNPPYNKAQEFVEHALEIVKKNRGVVAMLLRNEWDSAATRQHLFQYPFAGKLVLTKRPKWIEGSKGSPRHNFSWFVWDYKHVGAPILRYQKNEK